MAFNFDMTLGELIANERAVEVIAKYLDRELLDHPGLDSIKHMTINQLKPHADFVVTPEFWEKIELELNELE